MEQYVLFAIILAMSAYILLLFTLIFTACGLQVKGQMLVLVTTYRI